MKAIVNKDGNFGTLNGVITKNSEIQTVINQHLKAGTAKKLVDTETTLMYELGDCEHNATSTVGNEWECMKCGKKVTLVESPKSNLHPIFAEALKPFGIR